MKNFYILTLILISLNSHAQDCNIGNENATGSFTAGLFADDYLPIQKLAKIFPNKSSVEISPVICPK